MLRHLWLFLVGLLATSPLSAQELKLRQTLACDARRLAFSADGKTLASSNNLGEIRLWNLASGRNTASLSEHSGEFVSVVFSPDGRMLASASDDKPITLWDLTTGRNVASLPGHGGYARPLAFSPDGKLLASGGSATINLWDVAAGKPLSTLAAWYPHSLAFSPDGKILAAVTTGITLWEIGTGKSTVLLKDVHQHYGSLRLAFGPNGKTFAVAGSLDIETIRLWNTASPKESLTLAGHLPCGVASFAFTPEGRAIVSLGVNDGKVKVWDVDSGKNTATLAVQPADFVAGAFSADGKILALAYRDKTVRVLELKADKEAAK